MTVPADSAKDRVQTATTGLVDLRESGRWVGGSHTYDGGEQLVTGWHFHDVHEIEYACRGVVEVKTQAGHYLLPPHQSAWIPAGLQHQTTLHADGRTLAVLLEPRLVPAAGDRVRIIAVSALLREMMLYSVRWPISRTESGVEADSFFQALGYVVADALEDERPLNLPVSADPVVTAATDYTRAHLDRVAVSDVTRAAGVSERTLRRIFNPPGHVVAKLPAACPCASFHGPAVPAGPFRPRGVHRRGFRRRRGVRSIVRQALRGDPLRLQTTNQRNTLNHPQLPQRPRQLPANYSCCSSAR